MKHALDNKPEFGVFANGQEFKASGRPFGNVWMVDISDKQCRGCLMAKPGTPLYIRAEEPTTIRLEVVR